MRPYKAAKLEAALRNAVGDFLEKRFGAPGRLLTVHRVALSSTLAKADVFVTIYPEEQSGESLRALEREKAALRRYIATHLKTRIIPIFEFIIGEGHVAMPAAGR